MKPLLVAKELGQNLVKKPALCREPSILSRSVAVTGETAKVLLLENWPNNIWPSTVIDTQVPDFNDRVRDEKVHAEDLALVDEDTDNVAHLLKYEHFI